MAKFENSQLLREVTALVEQTLVANDDRRPARTDAFTAPPVHRVRAVLESCIQQLGWFSN